MISDKPRTHLTELACLWCRMRCRLGRYARIFGKLRRKYPTSRTEWRSEVNSNCRYRFVNGSDDSIRLSFANIETKLQSALRVALAKEKMFAA